MGLVDFLILALVGALFWLAVRAIRRGKTGSCCGNCSACRGCSLAGGNRVSQGPKE